MDQASTDNTARCLTCGYLLHGLPEPVCPECGRGFDPADESTFDTRPPGWRKRRRIKRGCVAMAVGVLVWALCPRGIIQSRLTLKCSRCGNTVVFTRNQLKPPAWIPWRYPGITRKSMTSAGSANIGNHEHAFDATVRIALNRRGSSMSGTSTSDPSHGKYVWVNDIRSVPANGDAIVDSMLARPGPGFSIGNAATPQRTP